MLMSKFRITMIIIFLLATCCHGLSVFAQEEASFKTAETSNGEDSAVKAAVEQFLVAFGNDEQEKMKSFLLPNSNIASISMLNGEPEIFTMTTEMYLLQREGKQNKKFQEPVRQYTVNVSQGVLAFVRADATVYYDGIASHHTNDFFILMKDKGVWKILSGTFSTLPLTTDN